MSRLIDRGASMMNRLMAEAAEIVSGTYTRKVGGSTVTLTGFVAGKSVQTAQAGPGEPVTRHEFTERDIIGPVESLEQSGTPFTPTVGDRWTETINGTAYTFEVKPALGFPAWDWSDSTRTRVRIRGKRV